MFLNCKDDLQPNTKHQVFNSPKLAGWFLCNTTLGCNRSMQRASQRFMLDPLHFISQCPELQNSKKCMSTAKHRDVWLPRKCDYPTHTHTDRPQTKRSPCATTLRRQHKMNKVYFYLLCLALKLHLHCYVYFINALCQNSVNCHVTH